MSNSEQLAELSSLEAIYEGSKEVTLELPQLEQLPDDVLGQKLQLLLLQPAGLPLEAIFPYTKVGIKIWLPPGYLADDDSTELPSFELNSQLYSPECLQHFEEELKTLAETLCGSPVLFSWLEWLRVEARTAFSHGSAVFTKDKEFDGWSEFENDIPTSGAEDDMPATCESCAATIPSASSAIQLKSCNHCLCWQCASTASQVFAANKKIPFCPLPDCRKSADELLAWDGDADLWPNISKRILATPLKDSVVFCPRCEDRGHDIPVVTSPDSSSDAAARDTVHCPQCRHVFCAICRSPSHSGSCFDDSSRVVRMAKRRPPLTLEMSEKAAIEAARIREEEMTWEQLCLKELNEVQLRSVPMAESVQQRFMKGMDSAHSIKPAFHGTDPRNYQSIFSRGLLIPSAQNGLKVVHGSAHGFGIYTANVDAAWLSRGFCTADSMLVCAVRQQGVTCVGDAMVVFNEGNVIPLFEGYIPQEHEVRSKEQSWSTLPAVRGLSNLPAAAPKPVLKASAPPPKPATKPSSKPAAKPSKFLARLAARSKKH